MASEEKQNTKRLETLRALEKDVEQRWETEKTFEVNAPATQTGPKRKFFATFPFAYMNGALHLGHAFTFSKSDFAAGYWAMKGYDVLYPNAFHCTGMPISAAAERLKRELAEENKPSTEAPKEEQKPVAAEPSVPDPAKQKGKSNKTKLASKTVKSATQKENLIKSGIPPEEVPKFTDARYWVSYWPPLGMKHYKEFGMLTDWRRSFITTDINPYYDSFIRWQFTRLREKGLIKFGKRLCIYSQRDGQACADHDRTVGEGVTPQEYVIIKMRLPLENIPPQLSKVKELAEKEGEEVFLAAATLRPETMYGQTNCWVGVDCNYGAFKLKKGQGIVLCTKRAAQNLAHQLFTDEFGVAPCIETFTGKDLIGCFVKPCLSPIPLIPVLPFGALNEGKGTGIVTSVPSDAPDDYWGIEELQTQPALREKYGVKEEWVKDIKPIPIIEVEIKNKILRVGKAADAPAADGVDPNGTHITNLIARDYCEEIHRRAAVEGKNVILPLKAEAKAESYRASFYSGRLVVDGPYKGMDIKEAKTQVRDDMIKNNDAFLYSEPESLVISRSGDECIVALLDQWYLDYGVQAWKDKTYDALDHCNVFFPEVRKTFERTIAWLHEWGCSRQFGLGTRLPWDENVLIESLSDSTIYNAYYTIAHFLQGDINGSKPGLLNLRPEDLTLGCWDYIFTLQQDENAEPADLPADKKGNKEFMDKLRQMRHEFLFWYPVDVRVSGKDLIRNHLTFFLYNHTAMFDQSLWPQGIRPNGHLMLNGEKMSKSTGNFITLIESIEKFSATGLRWALADAGDSWDDANFETNVAVSGLKRLTKELAWIEETVAQLVKDLGAASAAALFAKPYAVDFHELLTNPDYPPRAAYSEADLAKVREAVEGFTFFERVFDARMNSAIRAADKAYSQMLFREALTQGFFVISDARDQCREMNERSIHPILLAKYIEASTLSLGPICRQYAEHIWRNILGKPSSITKGTWPLIGKPAELTNPRARHPAGTPAATAPEAPTPLEIKENQLIEQGEYFIAVLKEIRAAVQKLITPRKPKAAAPKKAAAAPGETENMSKKQLNKLKQAQKSAELKAQKEGAPAEEKKEEKKEEPKKEEPKKEEPKKEEKKEEENKIPHKITANINVRDELFQWQVLTVELLRLLFPTAETAANAMKPSLCSCPRCTAAVADDGEGKNKKGAAEAEEIAEGDAPAIPCTKQPPAYDLFKNIAKTVKTLHRTQHLPADSLEALARYEERLKTEFGVSVAGLPAQVEALLARIAAQLIVSKSGARLTDLKEPTDKKDNENQEKIWKDIVSDLLSFGTYKIERAARARNTDIFITKPLFQESGVLTDNKEVIRRAIAQVLFVAEKTLQKAGAPAAAAAASEADPLAAYDVTIDINVVPPASTEDKIAFIINGNAADRDPADKLSVLALRSAPTKPTYGFTTN